VINKQNWQYSIMMWHRFHHTSNCSSAFNRNAQYTKNSHT